MNTQQHALTADEEEMWGDVPDADRLAWLRVCSRNWPTFPGATIGAAVADALRRGMIAASRPLAAGARAAYDAGFTATEYDLLRTNLYGRSLSGFTITRDKRPRFSDAYYVIEPSEWRGWLTLLRAGETPPRATDRFLDEHQKKLLGSEFVRPDRWDISLNELSGRDGKFAWWLVLEVFPPKRSPQRTREGEYAFAGDGALWEAEIRELIQGMKSAGFSAQDYFRLCVTLEKLDLEQWAQIDKELLTGTGVETRNGWNLAPIPHLWSPWLRLVHEEGVPPWAATNRIALRYTSE